MVGLQCCSWMNRSGARGLASLCNVWLWGFIGYNAREVVSHGFFSLFEWGTRDKEWASGNPIGFDYSTEVTYKTNYVFVKKLNSPPPGINTNALLGLGVFWSSSIIQVVWSSVLFSSTLLVSVQGNGRIRFVKLIYCFPQRSTRVPSKFKIKAHWTLYYN